MVAPSFADPEVGILPLNTNGKAMCIPCRLWKSQNARRETLRIVVLDEKRREEVQKLVSLVYTLAEVGT